MQDNRCIITIHTGSSGSLVMQCPVNTTLDHSRHIVLETFKQVEKEKGIRWTWDDLIKLLCMRGFDEVRGWTSVRLPGF